MRDERKRRGWSQEELAERLTKKGVEVHTSTIAKIESTRQPRAVRLAEAAAIAGLFDVSLDALLGRSVAAEKDAVYAFEALLHTARQAAWQTSSIEDSLRDRLAELAAPDLTKGWVGAVQSDCARACDALAEATSALQAALKPPGGDGVRRLTRKLLLQELQKRGDDEA